MVVGLRRGCRYIVTGRKLCNLNSPNISSTDYSAAPASAAVLYAQIANPTQARAAARRSRPAWRINSPRRPLPTAPVGIHAATRHSVTAGCIIQRTSNATLVWNVVSYLGLPVTSQWFERYHTVESFQLRRQAAIASEFGSQSVASAPLSYSSPARRAQRTRSLNLLVTAPYCTTVAPRLARGKVPRERSTSAPPSQCKTN